MSLKERLTKLLDEFPVQMEWHDTDELAEHLISHGVTIQNWIPVSERLPENSLAKGSKVKQIKVLVAYKTNGRWVIRTQIRAKGRWYGAPERWEWVKTSDPINYWAPLPMLPDEVIQ